MGSDGALRLWDAETAVGWGPLAGTVLRTRAVGAAPAAGGFRRPPGTTAAAAQVRPIYALIDP